MSRPPFNTNVSFEAAGAPPRPPPKGSSSKNGGYENAVPTLGYEEAGYASGGFSQGGADVRRKKSMVRPERERIEPGHRLYHYQQHAADQSVRVHPSGEFGPLSADLCSVLTTPQPPVTSHMLLTEVEHQAFVAASRCWDVMATRSNRTSRDSTCSSVGRPFAARHRAQLQGPGMLPSLLPLQRSRAAAAPTLRPAQSTAG